jgi:ribonuclease Z
LSPRVRVRLLGTANALVTNRAQASFLVESLDGSDARVLLDCANGYDAVRQLQAAGIDPRDVRDIFVSHQHADHIGGLDPLLLWSAIRTLRDTGKPPSRDTFVYADPRIIDCFERLMEATATTTAKLHAGRLKLTGVRHGQRVDLAAGGTLTPVEVDHEPRDSVCLGCVVEMNGARIGYSADTRPSEALARACHGVDLLLHEAGGTREHAEVLHRVGHSTASDAGMVAKMAGAKLLVLVHTPEVEGHAAMAAEAEAAFEGPVIIGHDGQVIDL